MAGERTEKATPKRLEQAKNKGQIPKSQDFNSAVMLTIGLYLIHNLSSFIFDRLKFDTINTFTNLDPHLITRASFLGYLGFHCSLVAMLLLPILLILMVAGIILLRVQVGHMFTTETLVPNWSTLNPAKMITGLKKYFDLKALVELLKSFIKMAVVGWVCYSVIMDRKDQLLNLIGADLQQVLGVIGSIIIQLFTQVCIILIAIGIADKKYQAWEFDKSMKMTKEDVKDEHKNTEGDPKIKAKIKAIQMQFAMQRMMSSIPKADIIITNPTHYAIAIRYDPEIAPAPQVVAKGVDFIAFKIREIAENNGVPIVENKPLARTLYKIVPLEGLIPAELYVVVAEMLAYVYKTNRGRKR